MVRRPILVALQRARAASVMVALALAMFGCARFSRRQEGAVIGAGAGWAIGAVVRNQTGSTARGAIIGAVIGSTGATIERVGEDYTDATGGH
ncbi:MAG TPA: hypothetical protein VIP11_07705 [Gemmatimonadaceae bacterium]